MSEDYNAESAARCPRHPRAAVVYTDPTGGDPFMGGPVLIAVCARCGRECVTPPASGDPA